MRWWRQKSLLNLQECFNKSKQLHLVRKHEVKLKKQENVSKTSVSLRKAMVIRGHVLQR